MCERGVVHDKNTHMRYGHLFTLTVDVFHVIVVKYETVEDSSNEVIIEAYLPSFMKFVHFFFVSF